MTNAYRQGLIAFETLEEYLSKENTVRGLSRSLLGFLNEYIPQDTLGNELLAPAQYNFISLTVQDIETNGDADQRSNLAESLKQIILGESANGESEQYKISSIRKLSQTLRDKPRAQTYFSAIIEDINDANALMGITQRLQNEYKERIDPNSVFVNTNNSIEEAVKKAKDALEDRDNINNYVRTKSEGIINQMIAEQENDLNARLAGDAYSNTRNLLMNLIRPGLRISDAQQQLILRQYEQEVNKTLAKEQMEIVLNNKAEINSYMNAVLEELITDTESVATAMDEIRAVMKLQRTIFGR
jgi:hypothetical protein